MKRIISSIIVAGMVFSLSACATQEGIEDTANQVVDEVANVVQAEDEHVKGVKNGTSFEYPDVTYGEAFEAFFGTPTWKYFKGTQEGPDDDGDGEPDYTEENIDIVEFTGYCEYSGVEVKALLQFTLDKEGETFECTYLSFNEVPQSTLIMTALLDKAFTSYMEENAGTSAEGNSQVEEVGEASENAEEVEIEESQTNEDSNNTNYPEGLTVLSKRVNPSKLGGLYYGVMGGSSLTIDIYSSQDGDILGNANIHLDSEIGGNDYFGDLIEVDKNLYQVITDTSETVMLGVIENESDGKPFSVSVYVDGRNVETYWWAEKY